MDPAQAYHDLEGRRATTYLLWRRGLAEYQQDADAARFLSAIGLITTELKEIRAAAQELLPTLGSDLGPVASRIESLEDQHLRLMVEFQQGKVRGEDCSFAPVAEVEEQISELVQELTSGD